VLNQDDEFNEFRHAIEKYLGKEESKEIFEDEYNVSS